MLATCLARTSLGQSPRIKFPVYIESTDSFGVAFYATYPVLLERSLNQLNGRMGARLKSVRLMKFRSPARLGTSLLFESSVKGTLRLLNEDTLIDHFIARGVDLTEETLTATHSPAILTTHPLHVSTHTLYHDEWRPSREGGALLLDTRTLFNLFERGRTDVLGGPGRLSQAADSLHVYVARVTDFERVADLPVDLPAAFPRVSVLTQAVPVGRPWSTSCSSWSAAKNKTSLEVPS